MNMRLLSFSATAIVAATLAACAVTPTPNSALEQARTRVRSVQTDAQVTALAPTELKRAEDALRLAEKTWAAGGTQDVVDHQAYLTNRRVMIAQDTAASLADQAVTASAAAERDKTRLALRTREADVATLQLADAQQSNARKTTELAVAEATAERERARVERRDARVNDLESQLTALNAKKTDRGMVVTLGDVLFDSGQSKLQPEGTRNMARLAEVFKRYPTRTASIEGYTDSVGSASTNVELSGRRAGAVMDALVGMGVPPSHLKTAAHGEESPVASNDTSSGRQMNRRVEIVFAPEAN